MAESAVSFVIDKLVSLLNSEVQLLSGVHKDFKDMAKELNSIRAFLRDAETRKETSEGLKEWVNQVRESAFLVEDAIDEYLLHLSRDDDGDCNREAKGFLRRIASCVKRLKPRHKIATGFQDVKANLQKISERSKRYDLISPGPGSGLNAATTGIRLDPRRGSLFVEESELVGVQSLKEELIYKLVEGNSQRTVICMVGMGGVGKTTLAGKIFENERVKACFDFLVWITVSQSYTTEELLWSIMKKLMAARNEKTDQPGLDKADPISLTTELRKKLRDTRYLVVFDDVWGSGFWSNVKDALQENTRGSRVVITTRTKNVGDECKESSRVHVQEMNPLPREYAWQLFCQKAFKFDSDGQCPEELKQLSEKIVERCGGLPLAIVTVGGLLSTKEKVVSEWEKLLDKLVAALESDPRLESIIKILSLSYDDLPYSLKACFLFLGMFPEDYSISRGRLIRLWVAEGFVNGKQSRLTPEDVAEEQMMQLVSRSLIQVESVNFLGKPKLLRVHDWIREVILSKSDELSLCQVPPTNFALKGVARRLSVCRGIKHRGSESITGYQTRSIMVFPSDRSFTPHLKEFKLLKVLDLRDFKSVFHVAEELGDLFHLGYLSLFVNGWYMIPASIFKLCNLETLDLTCGEIEDVNLQGDVSQLSKLGHLKIRNVRSRFGGLELKGSIKRLECLQTLYRVQADSVLGLIPAGLESLKQLRKLGIYGLKREHGKALCTALDGMANLRWLYLHSKGVEEVINLQHLMSTPPQRLERLELRGRLEKLPEWLPRLRNLVFLMLYRSRLKEDPFPVLQSLPRLEQLYTLEESSVEVIAGGGFPKLKLLQVDREIQPPEIIKGGGAIRGPHRAS